MTRRRRDARGVRLLRGARRALASLAVAIVVALLVVLAWGTVRGRPEDLPWTALDLGAPIGRATAGKIVRLGREGPRCRALLRRAGIRYTPLPAVDAPPCGYRDAVRLERGGAATLALSPVGVGMSCPVAAALAVWEWNVVAPAARRLGTRGVAIEHLGAYNCRRIRGGTTRSWSEHATADAIDIAGFRFADGRRVTVAGNWHGTGSDARFLHAVRDGACGVFATVLSPDYNAVHHDHLHLDQAERGAWGWRACR